MRGKEAMMNSMAELTAKVERLKRLAKEVDADVEILSHCRLRGLDYNNRVDYGQALRKAAAQRSESEGGLIGELEKSAMRIGNHIANMVEQRYNSRNDNISGSGQNKHTQYGFWDRAKSRVGGRTIKNNTNDLIAIFGVPRENTNTTILGVLRPGQSSESEFEDAEAVMIRPGQKFFKSKTDMEKAEMGKDVEPVTEGLIKVGGGITVAEVARSRKFKDVFFVNATNTEYKERGTYPNNWPQWKMKRA